MKKHSSIVLKTSAKNTVKYQQKCRIKSGIQLLNCREDGNYQPNQ